MEMFVKEETIAELKRWNTWKAGELARCKTNEERCAWLNSAKNRGPWNDTGRTFEFDGKIFEATGNFSDGGVKYLDDGKQKWMPRDHVNFT